MAAVFLGFIIILAMQVLPLHVHQRLGLGTFLVGLVAGGQFAAAIVSPRVFSAYPLARKYPRSSRRAGDDFKDRRPT
jgi:hypothetical protein